MKKSFTNIFAAATLLTGLGGFTTVFGQTGSDVAAKFVDQAKAASDSKLGDIAAELTGKVQSLENTAGVSDTIKSKLDGTLKSLTGGMDSAALTSAFDLVKSSKLTAEQMNLAKQVGNLASAYVVQKNFSSLDGAQGDVATLVNSLRGGKLTAVLPPLKNIAQNVKLTAPQKQLITTIGDKYAPGLSKASGALDGIKKLPGF
jgi:hypothetical protein